ncbi:alpha-amylase family glycosyl hydrolase [Cohnella sp. GCM10027633]|uniref:alpha-amylase family glycosyl hydrolase n=1 Tax=unclassified Cohnella TaxID=2636738 RepID=UPI003639FC83
MIRRLRAGAVMLAGCGLLLSGCQNGGSDKTAGPSNAYYEIFVRSFADSNGDGVGDLNGVTNKLDYIHKLGVDGIWLMPIQPSPSYHGYDVTDYYGIEPDYGTPEDFKKLIDEAHKRGIKIIMDLVVNHTSVEHPWFVDSASGKASERRDWYTWASDIGGASPSDGATGAAPWHSRLGDEYLGIFWEGMPDLNFDNPDVRKEIVAIGQYWLKQGVDGFRLDAAKHIYGDFNSTLKTKRVKDANQVWWQEFRRGMNEVNPEAYLVGEVWDATAVIGPYLNDALDSAFNFDLAANLLSAADSEKASDFGFTLSRVHDYYAKQSGGQAVDAVFLSNHDQNRVMSALKGNVDHARTAAAMLLTLPGNAFIYYGEELGMTGVKPDERLREPFPWTIAPGDPAETTWEAATGRGDGQVSVEAEDETPRSLLNHYRTLISWRAQYAALRGGTIGSYETDNDAIVSYVRSDADQTLLVLHNLSGEPQTVSLAETPAQPEKFSKIILTTSDGAGLEDRTVSLPPYTSVVLRP